jgi:hypothetical protein
MVDVVRMIVVFLQWLYEPYSSDAVSHVYFQIEMERLCAYLMNCLIPKQDTPLISVLLHHNS